MHPQFYSVSCLTPDSALFGDLLQCHTTFVALPCHSLHVVHQISCLLFYHICATDILYTNHIHNFHSYMVHDSLKTSSLPIE
ncbi:unnamed protein product [Haemonchus placei]|uniref:Uncharacterized protein n=1 Tax=Haemonchus placei TaxID=6290 RepID=A0A3P7TUQ7_HAEPC|nr:unnamed protein product [Haemonchus placei]